MYYKLSSKYILLPTQFQHVEDHSTDISIIQQKNRSYLLFVFKRFKHKLFMATYLLYLGY